MKSVTYRPIGVVRSPFREPRNAPIQPRGAAGVEGRLELLPELAEGLADLDGFSHLVLVYHLHLSRGFALSVDPFLDHRPRGVFATRAPRRPNPIGLSVVRLVAVEPPTVHVSDLDVVDGTPLLDLKPHVREIEPPGPYRLGWLSGRIAEIATARSDDRFER